MKPKPPEVKLGDAVILPAPNRPGYHVWKVTGIHLGGIGCESLVTLKSLDLAPGSAHGVTLTDSVVPLPILLTALKSTQTP